MERVLALKALTGSADIEGARATLRRCLKDGQITLTREPFGDAQAYTARAEFLTLVVLTDKAETPSQTGIAEDSSLDGILTDSAALAHAERWPVSACCSGRADLLDIGTFTANRWGDAQAERHLIGLFVGVQSLVDRPELRRPFVRSLPTFARSSASMQSSTE